MENEEFKTTNQSLKIQLSLASLMFFSPFITHLLKDTNFELNQEDRLFIQWYISLGWINILLLGLGLISWLLAYFYNIPLLTTIYQIIVWILIFLLTIGCIWAITEIHIIRTSLPSKNEFEYTNTNKALTLLSYLPGYSIYLRYNKHDFDHPDSLLKESLFVWILFGITCFLPTPFVTIIIGIAILIRIVTLLGNINISTQGMSDFFNNLFYKNPEEIWAYIWWSIVFLFHGNYNRPYRKLLIETTKKEYQYLYDIKKFGTIQWQYWLGLVSIVFLLRQVDLWHISWLSSIALLLVLTRYGIMLWIWGRSPALPIMRELVHFIEIIIKPFTSKK